MANIYCSNCGKLISETSNFCKFCGAATHGEASAVYRAQDPVVHNSMGAFAVAQTKSGGQRTKAKKEAIHHIPRRHLCPRVKWSFILGYLRVTSILLLLFAIGIFLDPFAVGVIFAAYLLVLYLFASLVYNHFYYQIDKSGFKKDYGIIHKNSASIPYSNIQNVNIVRGLSDRLLGLARIDIETAGSAAIAKKDIAGGSSSRAEGHLPGLTLAQAQKVHDILLQNAAKAK
jgi:uncharacterized membrane protein YdbT with pleckstrin-like domain